MGVPLLPHKWLPPHSGGSCPIARRHGGSSEPLLCVPSPPRELLRLLAATTRAVGQSLLNLSALLRRLLDSAPQRGRAYEH